MWAGLIAHLMETYGRDVSVVAAVRPEDVGELAILPRAAGWNGRAEANVAIVPFDVTDPAQVAAAIEHARPDSEDRASRGALVRRGYGSGSDPRRKRRGHAKPAGGRGFAVAFPRTLVVSTGYVYGSTDPARPAREEDAAGPLWRFGPYTDSKIEMESVARGYRGFAIIARPFSHTGPGQAPVFAVPAFARQLARIEAGIDPAILKVGNLSARRDLLDVRDVVRDV